MIGQLNYQSAAYTARYIMKKKGGELAKTHYTRIDPSTGEIYVLRPEFSVMSRRPGIGAEWYEKYKADVFPSDFLVHEGKKISVPRYYLNKLEQEASDVHKKVKLKRKSAIRKHRANNTPERLAVREEVKLSKIKTLSRKI